MKKNLFLLWEIINNKSLEYFMSTKQVSQRQKRRLELFSRFNFQIVYQPDILKTKLDALKKFSMGLLNRNDDERLYYYHQINIKSHNLFEAHKLNFL